MNRKNRTGGRQGHLDSCLVAVWLLLTILSGFLMLMLAGTQVQAAEGDMPEVLRYAAGFWYRVTWAGDGGVQNADDTVDVVVEERFPDGKVVSDMDRAEGSLRQRASDFPPVFAAGLLRLKNHGQITLAVPPELAYGDRGYPPDVPPGAMMIYSIRVSDVIPAGPDNAAGRGQE